MRLRGWLSAGLLPLLIAACRRDEPDVREPLGAHIVGASHPAWAERARSARQQVIVRTTASLPPATYTAEQAARGAQVYQTTCARCHPPGQLDGEAFAIGWTDVRLSSLFSSVRNTMPQDKPGSLSDEQYIDVIAYLLQRNRVPPDTVPLRPDTVALRNVRIAIAR